MQQGLSPNSDLADIIPTVSEENGIGVAPEEKPQRRLSGFADPSYWSPERRQEQRERWARLHAEGRLGGRQPGAGRPRVKSATELLAEKAADRAEKIDRKLNGMLDHASPTVQAMAIDRYLAAEKQVNQDMREDEKLLQSMSSADLDAHLAGLLAEAANYVDGTAEEVDLEDARSLANGNH